MEISAALKEKIALCPIFTYHSFKLVESGPMNYATTGEKFKLDIMQLMSNGYEPISLRDYYNYLNDENSPPKKHFVITMDDGYETNYDIAYPILKELNVPASIFIVTDFVGLKKHPDHPNMTPHFNWNQAGEMEASGLVEIHSHGKWHLPNDSLDEILIEETMRLSKEDIEAHLGKRDFIAYSYPNERFTPVTCEIANKTGYSLQMINYREMSIFAIQNHI